MSSGFVTEVRKGNTGFLLRIAMIAAIGGFLFGYDTGIISGAQLYITRDLQASTLEQQWLVGALLVGAVVGAILAAGQQLIGVNTVIYYSATILHYSGLSANDSVLQAISVGITNVIFTIIAVLLLDRVGRRPLLLTGTAAAVIALTGLGLWFQLVSWQQHDWLALAFLLLFMAGFAVGLGPVFWLMISEIYPLAIRSKAMSVATVVNWAANFLVSYLFLQLVGAAGKPITFWIYAAFGALSFAFFFWRLPETRHRSLEQIERELGVPAGGEEQAARE